MGISIIIPVKAQEGKRYIEFAESIKGFALTLMQKNITWVQIIIADESEQSLFDEVERMLSSISLIVHFMPEDRAGANDKMNGVFCAIKYVKYDNILLLDDHYRIDYEMVLQAMDCFEQHDCFKAMPYFDRYPFSLLIDFCGLLVINLVTRRKQYCGHMAFKKSLIDQYGFPSRDGLFDEYIIESFYNKHGVRSFFCKDLGLRATQKIGFRKFLEQRIRYAYENLAFPLRFGFHLSFLPFCGIIGVGCGIKWLLAVLGVFYAGLLILGGLGQILYGKGKCPPYTFLFAPVWFSFYPMTSWGALLCYLKGGVKFGGKRVKNPK